MEKKIITREIHFCEDCQRDLAQERNRFNPLPSQR